MAVKKSIYLIFVILSVAIKTNLAKKKSADHYFNLCHRNDPKLDLCITKSIRKAIPQMVKGIPDINFPSLDPFFIKTLEVSEGGGNFRVAFAMSNVTMKGLKNFFIHKFSINLKNESNIVAKLETFVPWIHFSGKYEVDGDILLVPLRGKGDYYMNCTETRLKGTLKGHTQINPKDKRKYLYADAFDMDLDIKGGTVHFYNLFNGNKVLGETVNSFLKSNFLDLFATIKHLPEQAFGKLFREVVNSVLGSFTYDELLLPN